MSEGRFRKLEIRFRFGDSGTDKKREGRAEDVNIFIGSDQDRQD